METNRDPYHANDLYTFWSSYNIIVGNGISLDNGLALGRRRVIFYPDDKPFIRQIHVSLRGGVLPSYIPADLRLHSVKITNQPWDENRVDIIAGQAALWLHYTFIWVAVWVQGQHILFGGLIFAMLCYSLLGSGVTTALDHYNGETG